MVDLVVSVWLEGREAVCRFPTGDAGQDMVEYALLAALVSLVAIIIIILVGPFLQNLFQVIVNQLSGV